MIPSMFTGKTGQRRRAMWAAWIAILSLCSVPVWAQEQREEAAPAAESQETSVEYAGEQPTQAPDVDPSTVEVFRPHLAPYGVWVEDPVYGLVWVPNRAVVGEDFAPYVTSGRWALTDDDQWIWVSEYPFGWAVFHYGRWVWTGGYGWAWIPGSQYSHAWVTFRVSSGAGAYVGWAPLPPRYIWSGGVAVWLGSPPPPAYLFVPSYYVFSWYLYHHIIWDHHRAHYIFHHTHHYHPHYYRTAHNRRVAYVGPSLSEARVPHRAVPQRRVAPDRRALGMTSSFNRTQADRTRSVARSPGRYLPARRSATSAVPRRGAPRVSAQDLRPAPRVLPSTPRSSVRRPSSGVRYAPRSASASRLRFVPPQTRRIAPRASTSRTSTKRVRVTRTPPRAVSPSQVRPAPAVTPTKVQPRAPRSSSSARQYRRVAPSRATQKRRRRSPSGTRRVAPSRRLPTMPAPRYQQPQQRRR